MSAVPHQPLAARTSRDSVTMSSIDVVARTPGDTHIAGFRHPTRIAGLDGLRGIAILAVMFLHFGYAADVHAADHVGFAAVLFRLFHFGWVGVDLFFVLSGFLITGILLDTKSEPHYFRDFYARRTLRIFPLYYAVLFLTLVVAPALSLLPWPTHSAWLWLYLYNVPATFRTLGLSPTTQPGVNFLHFWSLAVEEQFYLVWPLVVYFTSRRNLKWLAIGGIALSIVTRAILLYTVHDHEDVQYLTIGRLDGLCCGALLALGVRSNGGIARTARLATLAFVACIPVMTGALILRHVMHAEADEKVFKFTIVAVGFATLLALTLKSGDNGFLARGIGNPVLTIFGKYSYGLYVFHYLLLPKFIGWFGPTNLATSISPLSADLLFMLLASAASIVISLVSFHVFEAPILSLKRYYSYR